MLRSFRVSNHRSIRAEQELLLMPAYDKAAPVVPVAAIFGANASGKTNLLDALSFMQHAVQRSYADWEPGAGVPRTPFKLDPAAAAEPSVYVVELVLDGVRHIYGFEVDDERVREEWLYSYPRGRRRTVFDRRGDELRHGSTQSESRSRQDVLADLARDDSLFLSSAARTKLVRDVMPVYEWFQQALVWSDASAESGWQRFSERVAPTAPRRNETIQLLRLADLGIIDVRVERQADSFEDAVKVARHQQREASEAVRRAQADFDELRREDVGQRIEQWKAKGAAIEAEMQSATMSLLDAVAALEQQQRSGPALRFVQARSGVSLSLAEQSAGTQSWILLMSAAQDVLEAGSVLVVDEIDSSLHPRLTARLIELFRDQRTNPRSAQLLFTTHDATLLGTSFGREILARDQVWFVAKDSAGETALFPLTDFHPRKEENTERRYLGGSYGAVPAVFSDTLVEGYLEARRELVNGTT